MGKIYRRRMREAGKDVLTGGAGVDMFDFDRTGDSAWTSGKTACDRITDFAHLTDKIGITKASIHYHFPTKQRLAEEVVDLAQARFAEALKGIEAENTLVADQLHQYAMLFLDGFEASLRPLCGALSAELAALPPSLHERTAAYFRLHLDWLTRVLEKGITAGELQWTNGSAALARLLLSTLEGGSLIGRALGSREDVLQGFEQVLALAGAPAVQKIGTSL